jgi:dipeptidyl aminopeptidase/acylaminoacyl peptidase
MVSWADFEAAAPDLAAAGRGLLYREGHGEALLASVRDLAPPRIHPITVGIANGGLYAFILGSAKRLDLEVDGRYALHTHQDPQAPSEFALRGRAHAVDDEAVRAGVAADWSFDVDETYRLFEFAIDSALLGVRDSPDEWPPRYTSWTAPSP